MTTTYTTTRSFTETNAKDLASDVATDLYLMQLYYDEPSNEKISNYIVELVVLLLGDNVRGYLSSVVYGFKKNNKWTIALRYTADYYGNITRDDRSGRVPPNVDISGAKWGSFLTTNSHFSELSSSEKKRVEDSIPVNRSAGDEPGTVDGVWENDKTYSSGGVAMQRRVFKPR